MDLARQGTLAHLWGPYLAGLLTVACGEAADRAGPRALTAPIIEGTAAPEALATVLVIHRDRGDLCSGALIAPRLVLTTRHCVFSENAETESIALAEDGFRVSFGPDEARLLLRDVARVDWIESQEETSVHEAVQAGEDVAALILAEDAPADAVPYAPRFGYGPTSTDRVTLLGFGISSLDPEQSGTRLMGRAQVTAFQPNTGIIQVEGDAACHGDSGGPVLLDPHEDLVGVISQVGGSAEDAYCDVGTTFAVTLANSRIRLWLDALCLEQGGCGPPTLPEPDAGTPGERTVHQDAEGDAEAVGYDGGGSVADAGAGDAGTLSNRAREHRGGGCQLVERPNPRAWSGWVPLLVWLSARHRRRITGGVHPA